MLLNVKIFINILQNSNNKVTYIQSLKQIKSDEQDMQYTAGEVNTIS